MGYEISLMIMTGIVFNRIEMLEIILEIKGSFFQCMSVYAPYRSLLKFISL